jgi:hypothetical protein
MEPNQTDRRVPLDPQALAVLRAALEAVAQAREETAASPEPAAQAKLDEKKPSALRSQLKQVALALALTAMAGLGIWAYLDLTAQQAQDRAEVGKLRRELWQLRPRVVRKEEFNSRTLAAHALLQDVEASSKTASDQAMERLREQKASLNDLTQQFKDLQREAERFRERLSAREKRVDAVSPASPPAN